MCAEAMSISSSTSSDSEESLDDHNYGDDLQRIIDHWQGWENNGQQINDDDIDDFRDLLIGLVKKMRQRGELVLMRRAMDFVTTKCPVGEAIWFEFLDTELGLCVSSNCEVSDQEHERFQSLFNRAFIDCGDGNIDLWKMYIRFQQHSRPAEMRLTFAKALENGGHDLHRGRELWEAFRAYERSTGSPQTTLKSIYEQECKLVLVRPRSFLSQYYSLLKVSSSRSPSKEKQFNKDFEISAKRLEKRMDHEEAIERGSFCGSSVFDSVLSYIEFEQKHDYEALELTNKNEPNPRVVSIFERHLRILRYNPQLWLQYLRYLATKSKSSHSTLTRKFETALRFCPHQSVQIWTEYALHLERTQNDPMQIYERAFKIKFKHSSDHLYLWRCFLGYRRRKTDFNNDGQVEELRLAFQKAIDDLFSAFGLEADHTFSLERFSAHVEAKFCKRMDLARKIWHDSILIPGTPKEREAAFWLEFISLEQCFGGGNDKNVRKVFKRALARASDRDRIAKQYLRFEEQNGTLETLDEAVNLIEFVKCSDQIRPDRHQMDKTTVSKQTRKRNCQPIPVIGNRRHRLELMETTMTNTTTSSTIEKSCRQSSRPIDNDRTVFLSNIPFKCSEEQVCEGLCGALDEENYPLFVRLALDRNGNTTRGFGYAIFKTKEAAQAALSVDNKVILEGRPLYVSVYGDRTKVFEQHCKDPKKLFVRNIPSSMTEDELKKVFNMFGQINGVRILRYRNGNSKGMAYVDFETEQSANDALTKMNDKTLPDAKAPLLVQISDPPRGGSKPNNVQSNPLSNDEFRKMFIN